MYRTSFVKKTITSLKASRFERLRDILNSERYIPFDFLEQEKIDKPVLEEKVADFFEKVELLNGGKPFDFIVEKYAADLDAVVREHIDRSTIPLKNGSKTETRAKKYYDKAYVMKKGGFKSFDTFLDYSRIMLCLYMAIINKKHGTISDFDYSSECLAGKSIMESLKNEKISNIMGSKKRFDTKGKYSHDRCTFIMVIIMYQYIKNSEVEVEN